MPGHAPGAAETRDSKAEGAVFFRGANQAKASPEPLGEGKRQVPGSISFVPSCAGLLIAGEVIRDLIQKPELK